MSNEELELKLLELESKISILIGEVSELKKNNEERRLADKVAMKADSLEFPGNTIG
ncbi:hypothetical protein [Alkalibacillus salilacus]|uniref:Cell division protein ZapB n=1 Tax=Alkalibacillus salilacus TaxID=284582 RepID=A0ABT9VCV4_9BACI|nr:hypothetical protein [Alkalibacillus salilacus]MDQ0158796.1 hypothetical protein [Alkalibacillus salilacus]